MNRRALLLGSSAFVLVANGAKAQPLPVISDVVPPRTGPGPLWTGVPLGASLDLSFMTPGVLDPRVTFTRASTATYIANGGVMQTAAVNTPRWDYTGGSLKGLLLEEARGNIWLQSADASNAAWVKLGTTSAAPVVTGNQTAAPDGTTTAARVVYPAVSAAGAQSLLYQLITLTAAPYVFSVYLKGSVGGEQLYLGCNAGSTHNSVRVTLTTAWQRFTLPMTGTAGGWVFDIGTDLTDGAQTGTPAQTVYMWGAQVEQGAFPTSYIPTTASLGSRAQDVCGIPPANMGFFTNAGSWVAEFISINTAPNGDRIVGAQVSASGGAALMAVATGTYRLGEWDGVTYYETVNSVTINAVQKGSITHTGPGGPATMCLNAGAVVGPNNLGNSFNSLTATGIRFLQTVVPGPNTDNGNGYIRRVRFWPRVLTNAEMQQVTR